jgi:hypothetical protein
MLKYSSKMLLQEICEIRKSFYEDYWPPGKKLNAVPPESEA